jgi:hypothetical protein
MTFYLDKMSFFYLKKMKNLLKKAKNKIGGFFNDETELLATGRLLSNQQYNFKSRDLKDYEFKIFSQFGDDGIIQYLIKNLKIENTTFIEFGVEDYMESNTRFLMMNNNWSGFIIDGSKASINSIKSRKWFWRYELSCLNEFITKENINDLLCKSGYENMGLLHIDIDGVDYHVFEALDLTKLNPSIIILEYNSVFGSERAITVPYDKNFIRNKKHYSNLYFGASIKALTLLANKKGYSLIGSNSAGNNAYYVRNSLLNETIVARKINEVYVQSKFRESRNINGELNLYSFDDRVKAIKGLSVVNVINSSLEEF